MTSSYILVVGHGRSGTNFLHRLLDLSPATHCRNEPNELAGSPFSRLPSGWYAGADPSALEAGWDDAVGWTAARVGERDSTVRVRKHHLREVPRRFGGQRLLRGPRFRRLRGLFEADALRAEQALPGWLGRRAALERATAVLKLVQTPGWIAWVLKARPEVPVLHIVRNPGGFLNSWSNRYLSRHDPERVAAENRERLAGLALRDPEWAGRLGDITAMSVEESELWYWRYAAELIDDAGRGSSNYHRILYEDLVGNAFEITREVFTACGLPWDPEIAGVIRRETADSQAIASAWRDALETETRDLIEGVLAGSSLAQWWKDTR